MVSVKKMLDSIWVLTWWRKWYPVYPSGQWLVHSPGMGEAHIHFPLVPDMDKGCELGFPSWQENALAIGWLPWMTMNSHWAKESVWLIVFPFEIPSSFLYCVFLCVVGVNMSWMKGSNSLLLNTADPPAAILLLFFRKKRRLDKCPHKS